MAAAILVGTLFFGSIAQGVSIRKLRVVAYTNGSRQAHDLVSVTWGWRLAREAQANSERMARLGKLTHFSGDSNCTYRSENVGAVAPGDTLRDLHRSFMHSTKHRANILYPPFRRIGVGIARDSTGMRWVTVAFCYG